MTKNISIQRFGRIENRIPVITEFPIKLDVGCGDSKHRHHKEENYYGLDIYDYGQEFVWNVESGLPLPNNSVSHLFTSHVLEHLDDLIGVMNEFWRVVCPDGELHVVVPHLDNIKAWYPTHVRFFNKYTFDGFQSTVYEKDYGIKPWLTVSMDVNERPDIHWKARPQK